MSCIEHSELSVRFLPFFLLWPKCLSDWKIESKSCALSLLLHLPNWKGFSKSYRRHSMSTPSASERWWLAIQLARSGDDLP
jgi:hypothetical protein